MEKRMLPEALGTEHDRSKFPDTVLPGDEDILGGQPHIQGNVVGGGLRLCKNVGWAVPGDGSPSLKQGEFLHTGLSLGWLRAELCPLQNYMLKPSPPVPQNMTVFGDRVAFKR